MKSPTLKFLTDLSMSPATALPMKVVDDRAMLAVMRMPRKLRSCPRVSEAMGPKSSTSPRFSKLGISR